MIIKDRYSLGEGRSDPLSPILASFPVSPPLPQSMSLLRCLFHVSLTLAILLFNNALRFLKK